jgi:hypothetical protein
MVLGPFAETKVARLPGRNPATSKTVWTGSFDKRVRGYSTINEMLWIHKNLRWIPYKQCRE